MGLAILVVGLVAFIGAHVFVSLRGPRAAVIARIGAGPYKGLMSLVSLAGLILVGYGFGQYRADGWIDVWSPPRWTYYVTQILMWPASIFVVAAYIRGNIWRALKHPMLVGVKTWALAHLISNGDLGSIVLFGSFLAWAVYDRITLKHRTDPGAPPIPVRGHRNDAIAFVVGTLLYLGARPHLSSHRGRRSSLRHAGVLGSRAMSAQDEIKRLTAPDIRARKGGEPIVCLTSYHAHTARLLDRHCDLILVGDSLGMVMHGLETTVPVTLDMMILQGLAVMRGSKRALVVVDMPFGSYEASKEQAFHAAARVMKETGCGAIKLEGGRRMAETIAFLVERGVPVMAHIGLTPQSINTIGSFRAQGRDAADWGPIEEDGRAVTEAGAFSVVIEAVAEPLARRITTAVAIPTIGIGGSVACDGQILVLEDMLGLSPRVPKFVKRYGELGPSIETAVAAYAADVRARAFPGPEHVYPLRTKGK